MSLTSTGTEDAARYGFCVTVGKTRIHVTPREKHAVPAAGPHAALNGVTAVAGRWPALRPLLRSRSTDAGTFELRRRKERRTKLLTRRYLQYRHVTKPCRQLVPTIFREGRQRRHAAAFVAAPCGFGCANFTSIVFKRRNAPDLVVGRRRFGEGWQVPLGVWGIVRGPA